MRYQFLGRSGLKISRLVLGTYNFGTVTDETEAFAIMDAALDAGINMFDTANHYPDFTNCGLTEEIIGKWLAQDSSRRERLVLATKVYQPMKDPSDGPNDAPGLSKYIIHRHLQDSLDRLGVEHIDLYQMHHIDRRTTWDEIWESFGECQSQGKVRYVGSSNFPGWQLSQAQAAAEARQQFGLVSEQHKYNLLCRLPELEVLPAAKELGIGVLVYSPLESGMLSGHALDAPANSRSSQGKARAEKMRDQLEALASLARELDTEDAILAMAWILAQDAVTALVIGPRTAEQLNNALKAADLVLEDQALEKLKEIFPGYGAAPEAYAW
ncbi:MAG: aldo/keto reductase [Lentisphaeria bacterium]|nr:aldo/keto reductase [Lentisphaeria bacterium]NQZ67666.1 aldo/keto reductase [Lentisphaeria bacterium]